MKINSIKKTVLSGLIYGIVTFALYVLYTSVINLILGGENFIYKDQTRDIINGLSFVATQIIATILSALVPIILLRYKNITYYFSYITTTNSKNVLRTFTKVPHTLFILSPLIDMKPNSKTKLPKK